MRSQHFPAALVALVVLAALRASLLSAADVVAPNSLRTVQGDTGNLLPILARNPLRYQQVFASTEFASFAAGGEYITQIAFRVHAPGIPFTASLSSLQVNLSTTSKAPDALSPTFAENVGADDTVTFPAAAVQFVTQVAGPSDGPQAFDLVLTFATPFRYDPSKGNLLLDLRNTAGATRSPANDQQIDSSSSGGDATSRVYNLGDAAAPTAGQTGSGFEMDTFGAVVHFVSSPNPPLPSQTHTLLNSSTRLRVETGVNVLISGFIIRGGAKKVMLRGIGPSLAGSGVEGELIDPTLELRGNAGELIASNDDWSSSPQKEEIIATGIPPNDPFESAIVATLPEGTYTAILAGVGETSGVGLVEVFDLERNSGGRLLNLSTRGHVQTGVNVMIGGFIVGGPQNTRVIIRGIGPSLATGATPVAGALADPTLELRDNQGNLLETNDDWMNSPEKQEIIDSTLAPTSEKESAILRALPPATYTAIVRGVNGATGVGSVEIYELD